MELGKEGQKLFDQYVQTLVISKEDAQKIICSNKSALVFLSGESGLRMRSFNTNLSMLLRATVFRKSADFEPIKIKEILEIKKHYGIDIKPIIKDINNEDIYERSDMDNTCSIINCEYNHNGNCNYCGDYWSLNDENCISFIDKNEGLDDTQY